MTLGEEPTDFRGPECLARWGTGQYRDVLVYRDTLQGEYEANAGEVQAAAEEARVLIERVHARVRGMIAAKDPRANSYASRLALGSAEVASVTTVRKALENILLSMSRLPDLSPLYLPSTFEVDSLKVMTLIPAENNEMRVSRTVRETATDQPDAFNLQLDDMFELLLARAEIVYADAPSGAVTRIPGLTFEHMRQAAATPRAGGDVSGEDPVGAVAPAVAPPGFA